MTHRCTLLAALLLGVAGCRAPQPADILIHNGKVFTADDASSIKSAVAIRDGRIVETGGEEIIGRYQATRTVDLRGRIVIPGFNDTHIHIQGDPVRHVDLADTRSIDEIKVRVRDKAAALGPGEWVTGDNWSEDQLAEKRRPLRQDLDEAAPENPVVLFRAGGHSIAANSRALAIAEVTAATPDPPTGVIEHDADGQPNGIIREASDLVFRHVPVPAPEELRPSFVAHLKDLLELGITSFIQAGVTPTQYLEWEEAYRRYGEGLPRATVQIYWSGAQAMRLFGRRTGDGYERFRVGAIKVLVDGGFTGPAAYTVDPYRGQPDYHGKLNVTEAELDDIIQTGHAMGWQLGFHTIGDAAIMLTVNAFERALRLNPRDDPRHYVNHFTVPPPEATLQQMSKYGIAIVQQPNFTYTLEGRYEANLEGAKLAHNNPIRTPMSRGIFMAFSSDILPIGPMVGLYAAVTRRGMSGKVFAVDEAITIQEALRAYTRNGAYITREENVKGTIEPGRYADLAVLAEDLTTIDPARLRDVRVDLTIVGGKVLYERNGRAETH